MLFSKKKVNKQTTQKNQKSPLLEEHTLLYVSKKTGKTHIFRIPGFLPPFALFLSSAIITTAIVMTINFISLKKENLELETLRDESLGLQSEVDALNSRIRSIQSTITQITYYSEKIKKVTTRTDDRKAGTNHKYGNNDLNKEEHNGIGPLTKEEFEYSNKITGLKAESLELKPLFDLVQESEFRTKKQLDDLKRFLVKAQKNALKLLSVPDIAPVRGRLTSTYGWRTSPFSGNNRIHYGVDIAAPPGSPIYATANGVVHKVTYSEDYGKFLEIKHEKDMLTRYAHTSVIYVKEGAKIKKGDIVAAVGSTGHSTGPHVHYEVEVKGKRYDPENFIVIW